MRRALAVAGPADPAVAWERYADPSRWSSWSPQIRSVDASDARLHAATTGTVHGPGGLAVPFTVEDLDEDARRWAWRVHPSALLGRPLPAAVQRLGAMRLEHAVLPSAGGCLTTLVVTGAAPVVLAYAPVAALALRRLVR